MNKIVESENVKVDEYIFKEFDKMARYESN